MACDIVSRITRFRIHVISMDDITWPFITHHVPGYHVLWLNITSMTPGHVLYTRQNHVIWKRGITWLIDEQYVTETWHLWHSVRFFCDKHVTFITSRDLFVTSRDILSQNCDKMWQMSHVTWHYWLCKIITIQNISINGTNFRTRVWWLNHFSAL